MDIDNLLRRLRGALGNALVWGAGWLTLGLVLAATLRILGVVSWSWAEVLGLAMRAGIVGGIAGGVFAGVIRLLYHGRKLSEISWVRFGLGGGVFAGVFLPLFMQAMNLLSGHGLVPWGLVLDDALLTGFLGGAAAGGSMKIAQLTDALPPGDSQVQLETPEGVDLLAPEGERDA